MRWGGEIVANSLTRDRITTPHVENTQQTEGIAEEEEKEESGAREPFCYINESDHQ